MEGSTSTKCSPERYGLQETLLVKINGNVVEMQTGLRNDDKGRENYVEKKKEFVKWERRQRENVCDDADCDGGDGGGDAP